MPACLIEDMVVAFKEIKRTADIAEALFHRRQVQDLVVTGVFSKI